MFETYSKYRDSVYYDTSAWSMVNFYNMRGNELGKVPGSGEKLTWETNKVEVEPVSEASYAYVIPYDDYYAPAFLYQLLDQGRAVFVIVDGKARAQSKMLDFLANDVQA